MFIGIIFLCLYIFARNIVSFLSAEKNINAKVIIIEGYIEDYAYPEIIDKIGQIQPDLIITTGTSFDQGFYLSGIPSAAHLIAYSLYELGVDSSIIHIVPVNPDVSINRTYNTALVSKKYLLLRYPEVKSINLLSTSVHSRRSYYLFRMVFEPDIAVGNIVITSKFLTENNWYKSSRAFRVVISETIAWCYNWLFFSPDIEKDINKVIIPH